MMVQVPDELRPANAVHRLRAVVGSRGIYGAIGDRG